MTPVEKDRMVRFVRSPEFERGFDRGREIRDWVGRNKVPLAVGAGAAALLLFLFGRRRQDPEFLLSGVRTGGPAGVFRTGAQSTSMYSPQVHYTDSYGAWVLPTDPYDSWWT
jgi:hypothetical protein